MEKYERVPKEKDEIPESEVRLTVKGNPRNYINRAAELLLREENPLSTVTLKGTGLVIAKVAMVSNIIRHRIKGLH